VTAPRGLHKPFGRRKKGFNRRDLDKKIRYNIVAVEEGNKGEPGEREGKEQKSAAAKEPKRFNACTLGTADLSEKEKGRAEGTENGRPKGKDDNYQTQKTKYLKDGGDKIDPERY